jgi:two-component system, LytTR family, response regulator
VRDIRALIIDDERSARLELERMLEAYPAIRVIGEAANADEAETMIRSLHPDLLFLDIQMPGRSGFELLESLDTVPLVIFITAFDSYAVKAFEVSALDYLMKPVREERFAKAVDQICNRFIEQVDPSIFLKDQGQYHLIKWKEVHLIESRDNYVRLFHGKQAVLYKTSLNQLEEKLDGSMFFRTGRAQMINLLFIKTIQQAGGRLSITLNTGEQVEVSSRQAVKFKNNHRT